MCRELQNEYHIETQILKMRDEFEEAIKRAAAACHSEKPVWTRIGRVVYRVWPDGLFVQTEVDADLLEPGAILQQRVMP